MKLRSLAAGVALAALAACVTTGTPDQQYLSAAYTAANLLDQVTLAADAAVRDNVLTGSAARSTLDQIKTGRDTLKAAKSLAITDPGMAKTRVDVAIAILTAAQAHIPRSPK